MFSRLTIRALLKALPAIIRTVDECKSITEVEISVDGKNVVIRKSSAGQPVISVPTETSEIKHEAKIEDKKVISTDKEKEPNENQVPIKSPMVGTFYRAPSPSSKPYVELGQIIAAGQTVCIIEAMKLMNEIESEVPGRVVKILVDNGKPVEFGQTLFLIEPL